MNKHITPGEITRALVEAERELLQWAPVATIPATNPHEPKGDVHHPRLKGPYTNTKTLAERAKNWVKRRMDGEESIKTIVLPDGKRAFAYRAEGEKPVRAKYYRNGG